MKKGILILLTIIAIIICKDIPGVLYVMVDAETYELETYTSNWTFQVDGTGYKSTYFEYNSIYDTPVIHSTYWVNNAAIPVPNTTNYLKWNIRFKTKPSNNNYNITGFVDLGWVTKYVTAIYWVNSNTICNIITNDLETSKRLNFECKDVYIDNQYVTIQMATTIPNTTGGTILPNISRYINLTLSTNANHTYNNNASENIQGQQDLDNLQDAESNLMNSLDFSGANNLNVTINPNASNYIWTIVENLRGMNSSIVLLWTSILGLGILKLILNR